MNIDIAGDMFLATVQTVTGAKTFQSGKLLLAGSTSGVATLNAPAVAGAAVITLPAVTSTLAVLGANTFTAAQRISDPTVTTSTNSGALVVDGGLGVGGDVRVGGTLFSTYLSVGASGAGISGPLSSTRYTLGSDLSLIPVAGGQSVITTWWGLQLVGNRQNGVVYTPSNVAQIDSASVLIPVQQPTKWGLYIKGGTGQTGNLLHFGNVSDGGLAAVSADGRFGSGLTAPTAKFHAASGSASAGTAPLKFTAGTLMTTPEVGAFEYDGVNLFFSRLTGAREGVLTQSAVTVEALTADRSVTVNIGGTTYKLLAKA